MGGDAGDVVKGHEGDDILLGDNGIVTFTSGVADRIATMILGGGNDTLAGEAGDDIDPRRFGERPDRRRGRRRHPARRQRRLVDRASCSSPSRRPTRRSAAAIRSTATLATTSPSAAAGDDTVPGDDGGDMLLGDNGRARRGRRTIEVRHVRPADRRQRPINGSAATTSSSAGPAATPSRGGDGDDTLLGDNGETLLLGGIAVNVHTSDPAFGGADTIAGERRRTTTPSAAPAERHHRRRRRPGRARSATTAGCRSRAAATRVSVRLNGTTLYDANFNADVTPASWSTRSAADPDVTLFDLSAAAPTPRPSATTTSPAARATTALRPARQRPLQGDGTDRPAPASADPTPPTATTTSKATAATT